MEDQSRQVERAAAHFCAAVRLRDALKTNPRRGLAKRALVHIAVAGTIASALGNGAGREDRAPVAA